MSKSQVFLIDANALCYRSYYAIKNLTTSYGQATNAVYGFVSTLRKIFREYQPKYCAVCFDVSKKTIRKERFSEYKMHRPSMPDDLVSQIPLVKDVVRAYNVPIFELEGFEADDVIATVINKSVNNSCEAVIVSGDKDMMQLLGKKVKMFNPRKDTIIDYAQAQEALGFAPEKITDYIGLAGDKTDNLPGVTGIGDVTAKNLIDQFGSLEEIYEHLDEVKKEKVKENLVAYKDQAFVSKELAILDKNVPLKCTLDMLEVSLPNADQLRELFEKLEFKKFADEYASSVRGVTRSARTVTPKTKSDIESVCKKIRSHGVCAFTCLSEDSGELFARMVISCGEEDVYDVPLEKSTSFKCIFEDEDIIKVTHDVKSTAKVLGEHGISLAGKMFDVMLAGYLLAPQGTYDVATLAWQYLKINLSAEYTQAQAADAIFQLYAVTKNELEKKSLMALFADIEMPLALVLSAMEEEGVALDERLLGRLSKDCQKTIEGLTKKLYKLGGEEFNLNSPKQLSYILFEKLKLPVIKKTKTGFSTDEGVLTKLADKHELPALILEYRQLAKLKSTYIDALPKLVDSKTKRIHASFNQAGTETGRLSAHDPNLQNIPIRTKLGRQIRKAFIPRDKNSVLISADYSQIELRILAHLSGDKNLIKAFKNDQDIHAYTAALIFDVKENKVTAEMRTTAKRVNFGIIYGMSAFGLSKDLKISQAEAQEFIDTYFVRYPGVKRFMDNEIKKCEKDGFVTTLLNRRRYIPEITSSNMGIRQFAQRQAINTPVQGSAADFMKLAMINLHKELAQSSRGSRMVITVHDELVFDVPKKEQSDMVALIRTQMENPMVLAVPIKVSIKAGKNWLDLSEV